MKKIFVLFFALMVFVAPSIKVDAAVNYPPIPSVDGFTEYVVFTNDYGNGELVLFPSGNDPVYSDSGSKAGLQFYSTVKRYVISDGQWNFIGDSVRPLFHTLKLSQLEYSSIDIRFSGGGVAFEKKNVPALVLPPAFQGVEMGAVMKIVLEVTPIVVLSIVSFLGLRKALSFCLLQLRES